MSCFMCVSGNFVCVCVYVCCSVPDEGSVSEDRSVPPSPEDRDSGLFMLKKDSERRAILYKVLNEDQEKVISNLRENHMQVCVCLLVLYIEWRYKSGSTSTYIVVERKVCSPGQTWWLSFPGSPSLTFWL